MSRLAGIKTLCVVGDSLVLGTGDPAGGWVGRLAAGSPDVTVYNLGIRRDRSADVALRWAGEVSARAGDASELFVLLSWGVNDADPRSGVPMTAATAAAGAVLEGVLRTGSRCAFVGPTPVPWAEHDERVSVLSQHLGTECRNRGVPYLPLYDTLPSAYRRSLGERASAHPDSAGYDLVWSHVRPFWDGLLREWRATWTPVIT